MKKTLTVLLVLVLLAIAVTPALAAGKPPANSHAADQNTAPAGVQARSDAGQAAVAPVPAGVVPVNVHAAFVLTGKVTAVDAGAKTVTLTVTHSNAITRRILGTGKTVTLTVTAQTRFLKWTKTGTKKVTLADLAAGDTIMAQGRVANSVWTAQRILIALGVAHRP